MKIQTPVVEPRKQPKGLLRLTSMPLNPGLGGFTTGSSDIDKFIVESGKRNSVDPLLLYSIMHQESSFKPRAMSHKGARGLMQLMPPTAVRFGVTNIWDPKQNIEGGARYMRFLLDLFDGDVRLALATRLGVEEGDEELWASLPEDDPYVSIADQVQDRSQQDPVSAGRISPNGYLEDTQRRVRMSSL